MSGIGFPGLDSSVLLGFYQAQLAASPSAVAAQNTRGSSQAASQKSSATAHDNPPWENPQTNTNAQTAKILSTTNFLNTSNVPLTPGATSDAKLEQDNQKLFSLYSAVNSLAYLAKLAQGSTETSGQLAGLNSRFQSGLAQVQQYLASTSFNNYTLQAATPAASATSTATIAFGGFTYNTRQLLTNANINNPVPGLSSSGSFTIAVKKGGTTTNVNIDLSQVQGSLTLGNIVSYINSQLAAGGFSTRFQKTQKGGTTTSDTGATFGLQITPGGNESISLSAASTPALYMVGNSGIATETNTTTAAKASGTTTTTTPADQVGRLVKLSGISGTPGAVFSSNQSATTGTTTAANTVVDSSGNVYVVGNATGNFGSQLNQGSQDAYLTKYDSAGNVVWQKLLGSAGSANGYGLALDPSGGVVVSGSSTADLTTTSIADGNQDSFVARYDTQGNQTWIKQIQTLANNQANAVSVDASGNVYIGGSVSGYPIANPVNGQNSIPGGVIGAHQTAQGGVDAYLAKFDAKGNLLSENQFGTSGNDQVAATATGADGSLYVASVQNGEAIVSKYASGDITSAPTWSQDLGALASGGAIGGLTVSSGQIYVSGTTSNGSLTAGGQASIATPSTGGTDAFVFALTDNGSSVSANHVSYVGTAAGDQGGAVTVGPNGTVYLTGSTMGTFAGQQRNIQNVTNAFATAINSDGSVQWTQQYGGADGQSTGASLAVDPQGSSVLDALGLPRGTINLNQSVDLTAMTTLRAGDTFKIKIEGVAPRTATITIDQGETINSLATKINAQLGAIGKAAANYTGSAEGLKITVNAGNTIDLIAGPADSDALARLGISAGVLTAPATGSKSTSSAATASNSKVTPTFGLGFSGTLDLSTKTGADMARSQLLGVLSNIQSAYQKSNAPPPAAPTAGNTTGQASAATTAQLAKFNVALSLLNNDPNNAVSNIQAIVAGQSSGSGSNGSSSNSLSSLLAQLG
jgi:hypothetical protein